MFPGEDEEFTGSGEERTRRGLLELKAGDPFGAQSYWTEVFHDRQEVYNTGL